MGELVVNKATYNSIFVTWRKLKYYTNSGTVNSPPFALVTVEGPISFSLSINCARESILKVHTNVLDVGEGIIFLVITKDEARTTTRMELNRTWYKEWSFNDITTLSTEKCTNLQIDCKITWLGFRDIIPSPDYLSPSFPIEKVPFDNTVIPDFTIIVENQEIPAHKAILARHSPVLLAMFESPMKETKENKMTIEDSEYSTMKILLDIIYTGEIGELYEVDIALKVLQAAVKYQMPAIKILCEYALTMQILPSNVLMLLKEADKYDAKLLCETCVIYIFAVKDAEITEEFKKIWQKPNIAFAVVNALVDQLFLIPSQKI